MSNKDDGLSQLVQDVIDGKAEKKELCNKIYIGIRFSIPCISERRKEYDPGKEGTY